MLISTGSINALHKWREWSLYVSSGNTKNTHQKGIPHQQHAPPTSVNQSWWILLGLELTREAQNARVHMPIPCVHEHQGSNFWQTSRSSLLFYVEISIVHWLYIQNFSNQGEDAGPIDELIIGADAKWNHVKKNPLIRRFYKSWRYFGHIWEASGRMFSRQWWGESSEIGDTRSRG